MADDRGLLFVLLFFYAHNGNTFAEEAVGVGGTQGCERRGEGLVLLRAGADIRCSPFWGYWGWNVRCAVDYLPPPNSSALVEKFDVLESKLFGTEKWSHTAFCQ